MRISCRPSERYTDVAKQHEKTSGLVFFVSDVVFTGDGTSK